MFGRAPRRYAPQPPVPDNIGYGQMAYQTVAPPVPSPPSAAGIGGTAGWAPMGGTPNVSQQNGMFAGHLLNQFPALLPGVQLKNGWEGHYSGYYTPTAQPVTNGGLSQTTRPSNISGGQRWGSQFGGPIGPITAQALQANVTAAQVRQSGLAAMGWAKALSPSYSSQGGY